MKNSTNGLPKTFQDILNTAKDKNNLPLIPKKNMTFGQRAADRVASVCGSWRFIILVLSYIALWIFLNLTGWLFQWDVWPFIMLNLTLSCLAALQAPVILMSQNRQAERDRINARYDYLVDRKTEREVKQILAELELIHKKLDNLSK